MPSFAEADLLPKFTSLTGMQPDSPIPNYMRLDAKLFFTNFTVFRRPVGQAPSALVPPAVPAAPAVAATPRVDATILAPAVDATLGVGCALAPAVVAPTAQDSEALSFVKVIGKIETHS
jgi:hypothetical protein